MIGSPLGCDQCCHPYRRKDYHTGLSGTTMTHPEYRGKGLFPVLARSTYARMKAANMAMVWGFPNAMSHRGFVRNLNWERYLRNTHVSANDFTFYEYGDNGCPNL